MTSHCLHAPRRLLVAGQLLGVVGERLDHHLRLGDQIVVERLGQVDRLGVHLGEVFARRAARVAPRTDLALGLAGVVARHEVLR
jgi:hypothetical protein